MTATGLGFADLATVLRRMAVDAGTDPAFTFLDFAKQRSGTSATMSYAELDERVRAVAGSLQRTCAPGERVALLCPHEPDYVVAFLACLYSGVVGVPLFPPDPYRSNLRLRAVLQDCEPACLLATARVRDTVVSAVRDELGLKLPDLIAVDEVPVDHSRSWRETEPEPGALAYIQYTSGSTRDPAGVCITHGNLAAAVDQAREASDFTKSSVLLSWLPFFHDMGLVFGIAMPLSVGAHSIHMSPYAFIKQPYRWLRAIGDHRVTWTAAPNFAYDLCMRRVTQEQTRDLDLSSLVSLANGSEPVRASSIEAFTATFAPSGLAHSAHSPSYGLAEATLGVTAPPVSEPLVVAFDRVELAAGRVRACAADDPAARRMVGCGVPVPGERVLVVHPRTCLEQPAGAVGEIWVSGPNVGDGYWRQPERSEEVFGARLADRHAEGPWLRTGDLGFVHQGQLFVAGRLKDLIIVGGRNHDPADIDATVEESHPAIEPGRVAAFGIGIDGEERLVVALELGGTYPADRGDAVEELLAAVRRSVSMHHDLVPHDIVVLPHRSIPKTTSGKVRRGACAERYLRGELRR